MAAIPSPRRFLNAFKRMQVTDLQKRMLQIHYLSPNRTISAILMAKALGFSHHGPVNGTYGKLGRELGKQLRWKPRLHTNHGVARLALLEKPYGVWRWVMRPEIAAALEALGWVTTSETSLPTEEGPDSDLFKLEEHLHTTRELLASLGEAHSAFNTALLLQNDGINARFVDLTGWCDNQLLPLNEKIQNAFSDIELDRELPIVTGYAKCKEGLMHTFDRGYSEITFSRIACVTSAEEAIIHKEYHLSSADPQLVSAQAAVPICRISRFSPSIPGQLEDARGKELGHLVPP